VVLAAGHAGPSLSQRCSGVRLKLAAFDHAFESCCYIRVVGVEHIEDVVQLPPTPVDLETR